MATNSYPANGDRTPSARAQREEHWRRVVARQRQSGLTQAAFCSREGIKDTTLSWWVHELGERKRARRKVQARRAGPKRKAVPPAFVPVRVIQEAPPTGSVTGVEIVTRDGHVLRLAPGFDAATLRRAIAVLESRPC